MDHRGTHLLVDLYGCMKRPEEGGESLLAEVARLAGLTVLARARHGFPGGGETAFLLLSQSHASIHTWPENRYCSFDLYSCKPMAPDLMARIVHLLKERLGAAKADHGTVPRGYDSISETVRTPAH